MADFRLKWPPRPHLDEIFIQMDRGEMEITPDFFRKIDKAFDLDSPMVSPFGPDEWEVYEVNEHNLADIVAWATPEWLDVMAEMIIAPPGWLVGITPGSSGHCFRMLFDELVEHFNQKGRDILTTLLRDEAQSSHQFWQLPGNIRSAEDYITYMGIGQ